MNKRMMLITAAAGAILSAGCGRPTGWVIRPAPTDENLRETVLAKDPGLFVSDKIVIVDVDGTLMNRRRSGLFGQGENPVSLFIEKLDKASGDANVRAIVLRINSPGGSVTASDIMHKRLMRLRARRKVPVIAIVEDVGTSGGYYVACAADTILMHPTSVTGSIGVIVQTLSFAGTMEKLGITAKAVVSRPRKDLASPLKPLDPADLAILQSIVDELYQRFLKVVGEARDKLGDEKLKALADGRIYTGSQAVANGLADALGYMDDAIALAKKQSGCRRVKVVMYHRPLGYRANAYSRAAVSAPQVNLLNVNVPDLMSLTQPQFMYLWTGRAGAN